MDEVYVCVHCVGGKALIAFRLHCLSDYESIRGNVLVANEYFSVF